MLRRLELRDVVLVEQLALEFDGGLTVLTGETGAGKSILIDALQLALGARADAGLVREGAARAEVAAEFDSPPALAGWLDAGGFCAVDDAGVLLLRRSIDAQGRSRAWINGAPATAAQLREAADHLVEIHGQHAWQSLTRPAAVRALLDSHAGIDTAPLTLAWGAWRERRAELDDARRRRETIESERERLAWQLGELDTLAPGADEWDALNAEHQRLAHGQALLDAARMALDALAEAEPSAAALVGRAAAALDSVLRYDAELAPVLEVVRSAQALVGDAAHTLNAYLAHREPDPQRLAALDARLAAWVALARRHRRAPAELPALRDAWHDELRRLDAAGDVERLAARAAAAEASYLEAARAVSAARRQAAPALAQRVTQSMQQLGMAGGRFEVALVEAAEPQAYGLESVELRVAAHAGSTPRPLAKIASGGELSRLALAIAGVAAERSAGAVGTLVFDEIDAGVGGTVADSVGRLMKALGRSVQVLAVTHLAQVAAAADGHWVVSKAARGGITTSQVQRVQGEARVAEIARMLGGERLGATSRAHAAAMLDGADRAG